MSPSDVLAEAAALIRDAGLSAEQARRYRALASTIADPTFDRTLALGSTIRLAGRDRPGSESVLRAAIDELRQLLARSEAAIADVRASALHRAAAAGFAAGNAAQVTPLAIELFTDVIADESLGVVTWDVPLGGGSGSEHFASPEECAARIASIAQDGVPAASPPPHLGADDAITPVTLAAEVGAADSPVTLVFERARLPAPVCRLEHSPLVLFYAPRLRSPFTVHCTAEVTDEWWSIRPDAYAQWLAALGPLLKAQGLAVAVAP